MAQLNVEQFAKELGVTSDHLIEQLTAAGVKKALAVGIMLTEGDKTLLLDYLKQSHGKAEEKKKITLTRRSTTEIKKSDSTTGKARTIQVEVRKKRVLVKREVAAPVEVVEGPKPVLDAEQIAKREAEAQRHTELSNRQAEEVQRKLEAEQERRRKAEPVAAAPAVVAEALVEAATDSTADKGGAKGAKLDAKPDAKSDIKADGKKGRTADAPVEGTLHKPTPTDYPIHELLTQRWSPRAFDCRPVDAQVLQRLLEAARWAPSSYNDQPWAFIVAMRDIKVLRSVRSTADSWCFHLSPRVLYYDAQFTATYGPSLRGLE